MNFIMARDRVVASVHGRSIEFKKGVPTHVPPSMWDEVQQLGAVPEEELPEPTTPASSEPSEPTERRRVLLDAVAAMVAGNKREDFTAAGSPHIKALSQHVGWNVDARERDIVWAEYLKKDN